MADENDANGAPGAGRPQTEPPLSDREREQIAAATRGLFQKYGPDVGQRARAAVLGVTQQAAAPSGPVGLIAAPKQPFVGPPKPRGEAQTDPAGGFQFDRRGMAPPGLAFPVESPGPPRQAYDARFPVASMIPPTKGQAVGGDSAETVRQLIEIKDLVRTLTRRAARGGGAGGPQPGGGDRYGVLDALRPLTEKFANTRAGQIAQRFYGRLPSGARKQVDRGLSRLNRLGSGKGAGVPRGGGLPKIPGLGGGAAAEAAGAGEAAGGAEAAAGLGLGGEGAAALANPVGVVIAATIAMGELAKAGHDLAYQQEAHARKLAQFSPSQARNIAELDASRTFREVEKGEHTAETGGALTRSIDRWETAVQPIEELLTKVKDLLATGVMDSLTDLVEMIRPTVEVWNRILDAITKNKGGDGELFGDFLKRVADEADKQDAKGKDRMRRSGSVLDGPGTGEAPRRHG